MEYKIKEKINVNSLTFRKKVIEETIDLLGYIKNYTTTGIKFNLMLSFLDNLIEGDILLEKLAESTRLLDDIQSTVEPLYNELILSNEENLNAYNEILEELSQYCDREMKNNRHITGLFYSLFNEIGSLTQDELILMISQLVNSIYGGINTKQNIPSVKNKELKKEVIDNKIEDQKMAELIEKFKTQGNITK